MLEEGVGDTGLDPGAHDESGDAEAELVEALRSVVVGDRAGWNVVVEAAGLVVGEDEQGALPVGRVRQGLVDAAQVELAEERVVGQLVDGVVSARRVRTYCDLELASHPAPFDPDEAVHALVAWGEGHLDDVVPSDGSFPQLLARARLARRFDERVPAIDDDLLCTLLPVTCRGCRSLAQVRRADWVGALRDQLGWPVWQRIEALAPPRIRLPRGRSAAVDYLGERPVVRVRIQEVLGLVTTPRVGEGAEPVLLHLLAPNQRVQQITDDLEGFWRGSYRDVRKELRGRYPKHAWPEDPTAG